MCVLLGDSAFRIAVAYCLFNLSNSLGSRFIDEGKEDFIGIDDLFMEQIMLLQSGVLLHWDYCDDGVQFCIHVHFVVEPKLFNRLAWICQSICLHHDILHIRISQDVLHTCHQVVSNLGFVYFALQQMHPLGSSKKLLNGTPDSSIINGCSMPICPSANSFWITAYF